MNIAHGFQPWATAFHVILKRSEASLPAPMQSKIFPCLTAGRAIAQYDIIHYLQRCKAIFDII
jgi:hypothetical protein